MPIYEYVCPVCGHYEEHFQQIGADPVSCEVCGHVSERIPSASFVGGSAIKRYASQIDDRMKQNEARGKRSRDGINQGPSRVQS